MSTAKKVRLKQDEEKLVVAYANLKLKQNRLAKELDTMKQGVVNLFEDKTKDTLDESIIGEIFSSLEFIITSNTNDFLAGVTPSKLASSLIAEAIIRGVSK